MKATGTVRWYHVQKGYGFIQQDASKNDIFFHHTGLLVEQNEEGHKEVFTDNRVEFEIESTPKGPKAVNVTVLDQ
jgi:CspA family cold shock protein